MYGQLSHVLFQQQSSLNAPLAASFQTLPVINENLHLNIEPLPQTGFYKRFAESPYEEGKHFVDGTIEMDAHGIAMGWLIKAAMGRVLTTCAAASYTHEFVPLVDSYFDARAALPPNTIEIFRDTGSAFRYFDMLVNRLSLEGANGELLKVTADFLGIDMIRNSAATPIYAPTADIFIWDQASVSYNGVAAVDLRNFTVNFNNNLEALYVVTTSKTPYRIRRGKFEADMSGTFVFDTHSYMQAFEGQQENPFFVNFAGPTAPYALKIDFPLFRFTDFMPVAQGDGIVEASFTGRGMFSTTSDTSVQVTLTNTQVFYYGTDSKEIA